MRSNLLPIAKEGWNYIAGAILSLIIFSFLGLSFLYFLAFLTTVFFIFIFRNPERETLLYQDNSVVSPIDGTVVSIEEFKDGKYAYKVEVDSSYLNVSLLRTPFTSSLNSIKKHNGARLSNFSSLSKHLNENLELTFSDKNSNSIKVLHRLKQSFIGIETEAIKSQNFLQGSRYGIMINGITTLYLPQNFRLNISVGSELIASETLVGYFTN
jgi:phosphatidylserine decarboxylase